MKINAWRLLPFLLFTTLLIFLWKGLSLNPHELPSTRVGQSIPWFKLPVLGDKTQVLTPMSFRGKIVVLNVWASWCEACTEEQAFLTQLSNQGIAMYGLNYKDTTQHAQAWLSEWGNPYLMIGEDVQGHAAIDLGVYGAPESFLIDKDGVIVYRHVGILTPSIWQQKFAPIIKRLEGRS
jgi:cytochrome c biogenesis protein CcmG/thiol:disulfide interchange protein DsbE